MNGRKPKTKKAKIRSWRKGESVKNSNGTVSTHRTAYASGTVTNKRGKEKTVYTVYPTIAPKKKGSSKPKDWTTQTAREAMKKGEAVNFKSKKRAARVAAGSWKKGNAKKTAMKNYRSKKK
jgi:hypothetical protein